MKICLDNVEQLEAAGFFADISQGDTITVTAAPYIYMDGNFFYIIAVKAGDTVYLDEETGLKNMVDMMADNWSLF